MPCVSGAAKNWQGATRAKVSLPVPIPYTVPLHRAKRECCRIVKHQGHEAGRRWNGPGGL